MYLDEHGSHPTTSVELYLPWTNTWIDLPPLPHITAHGTMYNITDTLIMSLATAGGGNTLHLVGGQNSDWSTGEERVTRKVWQLRFSSDTHSYHWTDVLDSKMGKCGVEWSHVVIIIFIRYDYE